MIITEFVWHSYCLPNEIKNGFENYDTLNSSTGAKIFVSTACLFKVVYVTIACFLALLP